MPRIESQKANKSQKTPKKVICSKIKCWTIWVQDCQSSSPSVSWKLHTSLTQKDTMDRGAWIKNSERRHAGGLRKDEKSKSTKVQKCHGNEEQINFSVYHMLQSYGVQAESYSKTEVKNETHTSGLERFILTLKPWFPFSWTGLPSMIQSSCICHLGNPYI